MKILIGTLLHLIVIILKFGELYAMERRGSSSAIGFERQGMRRRVPASASVTPQIPRAVSPRQPERGSASSSKVEAPLQPRVKPLGELKTIDYMTHDVQLRIVNNKVVWAGFEGNIIPDTYDFYKRHEYLVRLVKIGGFLTVIYMKKDGSLMGVKAPNPGVHFMEPDETTWFIAFKGECIKVTINPDPDLKLTPANGFKRIALNSGHESVPSDTTELVKFPFIDFYVLKRFNWDWSEKITGAYLV